MATRTIPLTVESGGYTTAGEGEWVAFFPDSNNGSFGNNNPTSYSITFNSSYLYANYVSSVTMKWVLKLKIGGTWYSIYTGSQSMSKTNSDFDSSGTLSSSVISALKSGSISEVGVYQDGTRVIKGTSSATGTLTITYTEVTPSVTKPGTPKFTQNNDGTFKASWSKATGSNGSGSVTYQLWSVTDGEAVSSSSTSTTVTLDIPVYGTALEYKVVATYSGETSSSGIATKTFAKPSLSTPENVSLSETTGESTTISWTASSVTATAVSGNITYSIRKNGKEIETTTSTSYTFNKETTSTWGTNAVTLTVVAKASTVNKHYPSLTSGTSSGVSFTYKKLQSTIAYYNGSSWIECVPYYYNGSSWIECIPYYYNGSSWVECSH